MKAILLVLFVSFLSPMAMATGKLTLQSNLMDEGREVRPMVGLSVYEKLTKGSAFNFWTGYGQQFVEDTREDVNWWVTDAKVDIYVKRFTFSPGLRYRALPEGDFNEAYGYFRVDYRLW